MSYLHFYEHATSSYVPILFALMASKCKEAYWQVFNQVVVLSQLKIKVRTYCTDYEIALMDQMDVQFGGLNGGTHVGCFFHFEAGLAKVSNFQFICTLILSQQQ